MAKTVSILDDVHTLIVRKQIDIFEKYKVKVKISDLIGVIIKDGISKSERLLFLGRKQPDIISPDIRNTEIKREEEEIIQDNN